MYTLQIDVQSANPLDGTTPLNINAPGVTVDKTSNRTIIVTLDAALVPNFGRFDPGQVAESQMPRLAGKPLVLVGFAAISTGGAYIGAGNTLSRVTPPQGLTEAVQQIANLGDASVQGMVFGDPEIFPYQHQIALTTVVGGPTRLIFVLKELTDDDVVALGCCDGGGASALEIQDEGVLVEANTTLINFIGAGVTAAPGAPGEVDVTIPGALALELDMSLDPFAGADVPPFRFSDMPAISAQLALLPTMSSGNPVANRLWFGSFPFGSITPGAYPVPNSDIRGGDSVGFGGARGQTFIASDLAGVHRIEDPKHVQDLLIDVGPPGNEGPFINTNGTEIDLENITVIGPTNGLPGDSPFIDEAGSRWHCHRCNFQNRGILFDAVVGFVIVEDENNFGPAVLQDRIGAGGVIMEVRGTGNTFDETMGSGIGFLNIDIGHSLLASPPWSGAESINFGCGPEDFTVLPAGTTRYLYPGGGDPTSPAPLTLGPGVNLMEEVGFKDGIIRGIQSVAQVLTAGFMDVAVFVGGVLVYTETGVFVGPSSFTSTTFGFMSAGISPRSLAVALIVPGGGTTLNMLYGNFGFLVK